MWKVCMARGFIAPAILHLGTRLSALPSREELAFVEPSVCMAFFCSLINLRTDD